MLGSVAFVIIYFSVRLLTTGTLEVEKLDWGVDMGYTQLIWGGGLVGFSIGLILLMYLLQKGMLRINEIEKIALILVSTPIFFTLLFFLAFQFLAHDPNIDLYHNLQEEMVFNSGFDKIGHFLLSFVLTIAALKFSPRRSTILLVLLVIWMFVAVYELIEIVFIYSFSDLPVEDWLLPEIGDVVPDLIVDTLGIALGALVMRKEIKR